MVGITKDSGFDSERLLWLNHVILIGKMVISKVKYGKQRKMVQLLDEELNYRGIRSFKSIK